MEKLIIVGSGPAGTWAAYQAVKRGLRPMLLDVGLRSPQSPPITGNLLELRQNDPNQARYLLGHNYESLENIINGRHSNPRLKAPFFRYVTDRTQELAPIESTGIDPIQSLAYGGLAEAWGAGAYRYTDTDLQQFPISSADLEPYYDELTSRIGVSGDSDDLLEACGSAKGLQGPLRLDSLAGRLLKGYDAHRPFFRQRGLMIGRPRLAILSSGIGARSACQYDNLTCCEPRLSYLYKPSMTLDEMRSQSHIVYCDGRMVTRFHDRESHVAVTCRNLASGQTEVFQARKLILAAGAINSARIVLNSFLDFQTRLPLLDNPMVLIPFIHPLFIGRALDRHSHGLAQLNLIYQGRLSKDYVWGTVYGFTAPLLSDIAMAFGLAVRSNISFSKYVSPALALLQLFHSSECGPGHVFHLSKEGKVIVAYAPHTHYSIVERHLIKTLRRLGFLSHPFLVRHLDPGQSIHYAGTLPMTDNQVSSYRTNADGRLTATRNVYIADASVFPALPAKPPTLTIMANAMRTADCVVKALATSA